MRIIQADGVQVFEDDGMKRAPAMYMSQELAILIDFDAHCSNLFDAQTLQVLICAIIELRKTRTIFPEAASISVCVSCWHTNDHAGSGTSQQNTIGVEHILSKLLFVFSIANLLDPFSLSVG